MLLAVRSGRGGCCRCTLLGYPLLASRCVRRRHLLRLRGRHPHNRIHMRPGCPSIRPRHRWLWRRCGGCRCLRNPTLHRLAAGLAIGVGSPAGYGGVSFDATSMDVAGADGLETVALRRGLTVVVVPRTLEHAAGAQATGVFTSRADGDELAGGWSCLAVFVAAPAGYGAARLRAQVWVRPADRATNSSGGGLDWPPSLLPQHTAVLSVRMPQVCSPPTLTDTNSPAGAVDWSASSAPQQRTDASACSWQVCLPPAVSEV